MPRTAASSGTLLMPPWVWVERLAAQHAKRVMARSSPAVSSAGLRPAFRCGSSWLIALPPKIAGLRPAFRQGSSWLIALPPKISPAPVVSTTRMPAGLSTAALAPALAVKQPLGPSVA